MADFDFCWPIFIDCSRPPHLLSLLHGRCLLNEFFHFVLDERLFKNLCYTWSQFRILFKHLVYETGEFFTIVGRDRTMFVLYNLKHQIEKVICLKSVFLCSQFVKDTAERPHITFASLGFRLACFWTHIIRRTDNGHGLHGGIVKDFTYSKVTNFNCVIASQKQIPAFHVSVNNSSSV
jgi:hypothetical protein